MKFGLGQLEEDGSNETEEERKEEKADGQQKKIAARIHLPSPKNYDRICSILPPAHVDFDII